jgi:membrane fusion protein (multidrug efflux system)
MATESSESVPAPSVSAPRPAAPPSPKRGKVRLLAGIAIVVILAIASIPYFHAALTTVSTDDAYVNGHVTLVAPREAGQVALVLVEDNNRVHKDDLLVQLDEEQVLQNARNKQAASLAFFDVFWCCAVVAAALLLLLPLMRRSKAETGAHVAAE